jgi:GPI mannosyltransferase 3
VVWQRRHNSAFLCKFLRDGGFIALVLKPHVAFTFIQLALSSLVLSALCSLDSLYYGKLTITPLNFVITNLSPISLFYGSSPWHYYLTQGLPILCTTALPFALHGMWLSLGPTGTRSAKYLLGLLVWTISVYSFAGHKEWRFIHPLLPALHIFAAKSIVDSGHHGNSTVSPGAGKAKKLNSYISKLHLSLLLLNILPLLYLILFHARAQIDVLHYLRSLGEHNIKSAGFLMPCHSTPWQAYLHKPSWSDEHRFWSLGCEPPLGYVLHPNTHKHD